MKLSSLDEIPEQARIMLDEAFGDLGIGQEDIQSIYVGESWANHNLTDVPYIHLYECVEDEGDDLFLEWVGDQWLLVTILWSGDGATVMWAGAQVCDPVSSRCPETTSTRASLPGSSSEVPPRFELGNGGFAGPCHTERPH